MPARPSQGEKDACPRDRKNLESLMPSRFCGGRNRTRTCDPIDVNDVLCLGGKVCRKQMLGVHMPKNVDITGFSHFLPHPSGVRRMGVHWVFTPF